MKIVHIEDFFHPEAGYQINILAKYQARAGHEVVIVTSEIDKIPEVLTSFFGKDNIEEKDRYYEQQYHVKIIRYPLSRYFSGRSIYKPGFKKFIDNLKPDMLYVHGDGTCAAIEFILNFKRLNYGFIFDSHMLKMAAENPLSNVYEWGYRKFIAPIVIKQKLICIRTQDDPYVEKYLGIPLEQAPVISHATDQMLFKPDEKIRQQMRQDIGVKNDDFVVIYAGKLIESKGAQLLADAFKKKITTKNNKDVVLLVVGNTSGKFGEAVEETFNDSENRIIRVPTQKYTDLVKYYCAADLAVFPKQCSLSFYDVQACALPVVEEDNNINIDRLSHKNGYCFAGGDVNDFRDKILLCADMDPEEWDNMKQASLEYVSEYFSYDKVYEKYDEVIKNEWIRQKTYKE